MTYDVESSYLVLRQAQSVLGINLLIGTQTSRSFLFIFSDNDLKDGILGYSVECPAIIQYHENIRYTKTRLDISDLSLPPGFSEVRVTRSLVLYVCFVDRCLSFCLLAIVLSVLRYMDSDYPFGIFKLFFLYDI